MRKLTGVALVLVIGLASCGGQGGLRTGTFATETATDLYLPAPVPADPAYLVKIEKPVTAAHLANLERTAGLAVVTPMDVGRLRVTGPSGARLLRVGAVDPLTFRSVTPAVSRDAPFVWQALVAGQAVVTFDAAQNLGIRNSEGIKIKDLDLAVGALADNGIPNVADILVSNHLGETLGLDRGNLLMVGAREGAPIEPLGRALRKKLPSARLTRLATAGASDAPSSPPQTVGRAQGGLIGTLRFKVFEGGFIEPDPEWVASNISSGSVPIFGVVTCHRLMFPQLGAALGEIEAEGLAHLIRTGDYGGCYNPRFIDRDPSRALSNHAFGLAIDLNVSSNGLGTKGDMDRRIVAIFEKWGFEWGGWWERPDPMHFELARLVSIS